LATDDDDDDDDDDGLQEVAELLEHDDKLRLDTTVEVSPAGCRASQSFTSTWTTNSEPGSDISVLTVSGESWVTRQVGMVAVSLSSRALAVDS